jgi:hypothetical protein
VQVGAMACIARYNEVPHMDGVKRAEV